MLWLLLALLGATFLAIRNAFGVLAVLMAAGAVFAVSYLASAAVQGAFGYATAWFLLLGGIRPVAEMQQGRRQAMRRRQPLTSDADQLARLTPVPAGVWVAVFWLVAVAALVTGARLLVPASLLHPGHWLHLSR
jgi:hypothetical protein